MVLHFPENYLIHIKTGAGICILLVWAHRILGLNVLVLGEGDQVDIRPGQGDPHIVVDMSFANTCLRVASVTLLDSTKEPNEQLITIYPDPDESLIDGTWKIPARGYGKSVLEQICDNEISQYLTGEASRAIIEEMALVTDANAQTIAKYLVRNKLSSASGEKISATKCATGQRQILKATRFLFDRPKLEDDEVSIYQLRRPLHQHTPAPSSIAGALQTVREHDRTGQEWTMKFWNKMTKVTQMLSILVLAFAHVRDLNE
ncbi:hypothetical protein OEA41_010043 [Lepraria neglecta]|uniref:Uncharacterized protein n=1 Tax=Lepraria neglecta TaxID=209136 RepID=A0AAE0DHC9_9LECA|nr:hypothetical protein OEA41_010043 [Lepraria neglecta]